MSGMVKPELQQIMALACVLGATIGTLRSRRSLRPDEEAAIFDEAWRCLPDSCQGFGEEIMTVIRNTAAQMQPLPDEEPPRSEP